jgi:hypothetical protein
MKKLLIGLLAIGSLSVFANPCDENIKGLIDASSALGASDALLTVNHATANKFKVYEQLFQTYPERNEIGGYTRETLEEEIQNTSEAIENLEQNVNDAKDLIKLLKKEVKATCK